MCVLKDRGHDCTPGTLSSSSWTWYLIMTSCDKTDAVWEQDQESEHMLISLLLRIWLHIQDAVCSRPGDFTGLLLGLLQFHLFS